MPGNKKEKMFGGTTLLNVTNTKAALYHMTDLKACRRSIYTWTVRSKIYPMIAVFLLFSSKKISQGLLVQKNKQMTKNDILLKQVR